MPHAAICRRLLHLGWNCAPAYGLIVVLAAIAASGAEPEPKPPQPDAPLPKQLANGDPIRAAKLDVRPGRPNPYALLRRLRRMAMRKFAADQYDELPFRMLFSVARWQLQGGDRVGAVETLRAAEEMALASPGGIKPLQSAGLAELFYAAGLRDDALELGRQAVSFAREHTVLTDDQGASQDFGLYEYLLKVLIYIGDRDSQRDLLAIAEQRAKRIEKQHNNRLLTLERLGLQHVRLGEFKAAVATADFMQAELDGEWVCSLYEKIIAAQVERGDLVGAEQTLRSVNLDVSDGEELVPIVRGYAAARDLMTALEWAGRITRTELRDRAWLAIVDAQAAAHDPRAAAKSLAEIRTPRARCTGLIALSRAQFAAGDRQAASNTLEHALAIAVKGTSESEYFQDDRFEQIVFVAQAQAAMNDLDAAKRSLAESADILLELGLPGVDDRFPGLIGIAAAQRNLGDLAAARTTLRRAADELAPIDPRPGIQTEHKAEIQAAIAAEQWRCLDPSAALATFKQALKTAREEKDDHYRLSGMAYVFNSLDMIDHPEARRLMTTAAADSFLPGTWCSNGLGLVAARIQLQAGDAEPAAAILAQLKNKPFFSHDSYLEENPYRLLLMSLVRRGRFDIARKHAETLDSEQPYIHIIDELLAGPQP